MASTRAERPRQGGNPRSLRRRLFEFLGSMTLAITLLVALGVASAIGTILQQNQPYQDYLIKFGPFWFEVFKSLGLFDVYSAGWFLVILVFLIVSTSVCVSRNAPRMLKENRQLKTDVAEKSLRAMKLNQAYRLGVEPGIATQGLRRYLGSRGYRLAVAERDGETLVAARKGALNRWGYIFTHVAIVVICVGGMLDSRMLLKLKELTGNLAVETRDLPAAEVPEISRIEPGNPSFRGNVNIPEGQRASVVFLGLRDGYVVQELPFTIEVEDFHVEHYDNGQPKQFKSRLVVHDPDRLDEPLEKTISVNHPLIYEGHAIYQASFADGGSKLDLKAWQLEGDVGHSDALEVEVFEQMPFKLGGERYRLEVGDFRLFNINKVEGPDGEPVERNFGPSFQFKIRDAAGQAREYQNYMSPVEMDGARYFISGMRASVGQSFRYVHIPADDKGSMETFMDLLARLHDREAMARIIERTVGTALGAAGGADDRRGVVSGSMLRLVELFNEGGYDAIGRDVEERVPAEKQEKVFEAYIRVLQTVLLEAYVETLQARGVDVAAMDEAAWAEHQRFLEDAVAAINGLAFYGSPVFLQLTDFEHIQATGLQITKSPGKGVVYFGSVLLTLGVFLMFYISQRRLWFRVREAEGGSEVLAAGTANRRTMDFAREFERMNRELGTALGGGDSKESSRQE